MFLCAVNLESSNIAIRLKNYVIYNVIILYKLIHNVKINILHHEFPGNSRCINLYCNLYCNLTTLDSNTLCKIISII